MLLQSGHGKAQDPAELTIIYLTPEDLTTSITRSLRGLRVIYWAHSLTPLHLRAATTNMRADTR